MRTTVSDNLIGLRFLVLNELFFLIHLILVKMLGIEFSSVQIVFIRCSSSAILLLPIMAWRGSMNEIRVQLGLNSLRVILSSIALTINFFTISQVQLAQMSTIGYLRPAVTSLIAYFFLRESQSWHRWIVILVGFLAVLFIFSPESSQLQFVALLAIGGMCCGSSATILQKHLSKKMNDLSLMMWYSVGVTILTAPFALWFWTPPTLMELSMMIITGLLATTAQFFFIRAFRKADASFLAPMFYFHIIPTSLIGYFVFSEIPSLNTILGAIIILISLIIMTLLEGKRL